MSQVHKAIRYINKEAETLKLQWGKNIWSCIFQIKKNTRKKTMSSKKENVAGKHSQLDPICDQVTEFYLKKNLP